MPHSSTYILLILTCLATSCKNRDDKKEIAPVTANTSGYLDINGQIIFDARDVMETPYYMYRISVVNGKRDSMPVTVQEFSRWESAFLSHNYLNGDTGKWYKETTLFDNSTQQTTISYATTHPGLPVRQVDVLTKPESETIQRIFISRNYGNEDSAVMEKLGWHIGNNFYINKEVSYTNGKRRTELHQVFWK